MAEKDKFEVEQDLAIVRLNRDIQKLFSDAATEASLLASTPGVDASLPLAANQIIKKRLDEILRKFRSRLGVSIVDGVRSAWTLANSKNDELCQMVFGKALDSMNERFKSAFFNNHEKALEAFIIRKEKGLSLSDRVWNYTNQFRDEIETTLSMGIQEGQPAAEIARDLKQYLKYPDKLFRRVRDKETGELHLSKNAKMFHPGAGVNRSSYKNAVRLAATETNTAYRSSDYLRVQDLAFVVGIEVHLSNNHTLNGKPFYDICDELKGKYPKDFKFVGWHPLCYDSLSEVLTNHGWKHFADVTDSDLIFSLNPETRNVEWSEIVSRMSWEHRGRMVRFTNRSLDCLVTPEHQMVYISKSGGDIRTISADKYRQGLGGFYRSSKYKGTERDTIYVNGLELPFDAFCEFMGYWLSDGSACRSGQVSIAQQDSSPIKGMIVDCAARLGFNPHVNADAVIIYSVPLCTYLKGFGKCADKYVPSQIKEASRRQIRIFLDAFLSCDGHVKKPHPFVGNRGNLCLPQGEKIYFTTSEQLAADLGELIVKVGKRPSYRKTDTAGKKQQFRNGEYTINYDCYQISECNAATCTVFSKEYIEDYDGMVYDLELATNHIMYIRRRGKCFWGSNCRCFTTTILKTDDEVIRDLDGKDRGSVNEVKDVPPQFKEWLEKNAARIEQSEERGNLPYFLRDNLWAWKEGEERLSPVSAVEPALSIEERARLRHEARTQGEIQAIKDRWQERHVATHYAGGILAVAKSIKGSDSGVLGTEIETLERMLRDSTSYADLTDMARLTSREIKKMRDSLNLLDNPLKVMQKWGYDTAQIIQKNVARTMDRYSSYSLADKAAKYRYEAQWIEENRKDTIPTWKEAQDAYLKAAKKIEYEIEWGEIDSKVKALRGNNAFAQSEAGKTYLDQISKLGHTKSGKDEINRLIKESEKELEWIEKQAEWNALYSKYPTLLERVVDGMSAAMGARDEREYGFYKIAADHLVREYEGYKNTWEQDYRPEIEDAELIAKLDLAISRQDLDEISHLMEEAQEEYNIALEKRAVRDLLQNRKEIIRGMSPSIHEELEKALAGHSLAELRRAHSRGNRLVEEWFDYVSTFEEEYQDYSTSSSAYKELVKKAVDAIWDFRGSDLGNIIEQLKAKKAQLEKDKAYVAGIQAEFKTMRDYIKKVEDADVYDEKVLQLISEYETADKAWKIKSARSLYAQIQQRVKELGINLTNRVTVEDIRRKLGKDCPRTLVELDDAISQFSRVSEVLKDNREKAEDYLLKLMEDNDLGMDINDYLLDKVMGTEFYNTFQSGTSHGYLGSSKTTGKIEASHDRLEASHVMFMPSTKDSYYEDQLKRSEYEKYGHLLDRDKYESILHNRTHYGNTQVRFKRDSVLATFTFNDSLGLRYQPSLVTDPRIESLDRMYEANEMVDNLNKEIPALNKWQHKYGTGYVELQFHGRLTMNDVESITFRADPRQNSNVSKDFIRKALSMGIELWYIDGDKVVQLTLADLT